MYDCPVSSTGSVSLTSGLPECAFIPNAANLSATVQIADPTPVIHHDSWCTPVGLSSNSPRYFMRCTPRIYHWIVHANQTPICSTCKEVYQPGLSITLRSLYNFARLIGRKWSQYTQSTMPTGIVKYRIALREAHYRKGRSSSPNATRTGRAGPSQRKVSVCGVRGAPALPMPSQDAEASWPPAWHSSFARYAPARRRLTSLMKSLSFVRTVMRERSPLKRAMRRKSHTSLSAR